MIIPFNIDSNHLTWKTKYNHHLYAIYESTYHPMPLKVNYIDSILFVCLFL